MAYEPETMVDAGHEPGDPVKCQCGRTVQAQMMVRVSGLPEPARRATSRGPARSSAADYLCDGCRETLFRKGIVKKPEFARAVGAPTEVVAKLQGERE